MLENEMYDRRSFPARVEVATRIEVYFNRRRPYATPGCRTPAQAMADRTLPSRDEEQLFAA